MPGFDDRLRHHLERVAPPADPSGAFDQILEKKIKRRLMRRFQAAGLAVAVVAATIGGTFALVRAFDSSDDSDRLGGISPTPGPVSNGRIAYSSTQDGSFDIWTVNPDGTDARNLTGDSFSLAQESSPTWSPDGKHIAFLSDREGLSDIWVIDAHGGEPIRLTHHPEKEEESLAWSPDGTEIAFIRAGDVYVMRVDGSATRRLTSTRGEERHPTWAPDGSRIAFASLDPREIENPMGTDLYGIYVIDPEGGESSALTEAAPASGTDDEPDWSPDGKRIAFARAGDIHVMASDGSNLKKITDSEEGNSPSARPAWSPDGTKIVFERIPAGESEYQIHTMNADGSDVTPTGITGGLGFDLDPDWQPIPAGAPTSSPTAEPTPTTSPFPAECEASQVTGNFDGDRQTDTATVARTQCLTNPDELGNRATEFALRVQWPPSEGIAPLPECRKACRATAATDLNGDGIDEFILMVDKGASTDFFQVYELPASEAFGRPATVSPPGSQRWPAGKPAEFSLFGSVLHFSTLGCDLIKQQIIVQDVGVNEAQTQYLAHESLLRFEPVDAPPFGRFAIVSERDYSEPYDEGVHPGDQFEPGDPCWTYGS